MSDDIKKEREQHSAALVAAQTNNTNFLRDSNCMSLGLKREASDSESEVTTPASKRTKHDPKSGDDDEAAARTALVWADNRQALCDATPYFKSHQGGLYTKDTIAVGFMITKVGIEIRDVFGAQVVITALSGGRKQDKDGSYFREEDQAPRACKFWMNAIEKNKPVVGIAGDDHPYFPGRALHKYSVLAAFHVTDMWKEYFVPDGANDPIAIYKVRLEKIDLDDGSWWWDPAKVVVKDENLLAPHKVGQYAPDEKVCPACEKTSKQIFAECWTCLFEDCSNHFRLPPGVEYNEMTYAPDFLRGRTTFPGLPQDIPKIIPDLPSAETMRDTTVQARVGIVCPDCGCCSRRRYWTRWECENPTCDFVLRVTLQPHTIEDVKSETNQHGKHAQTHTTHASRDLDQAAGRRLDDVTITRDQRIPMEKHDLGSYKASIYALPNQAGEALGCVVVFRADDSIHALPHGPDALYEALQAEDIGLHRNAALRSKAYNEVYTRHFLQNFGAPYKFGVAVSSISFTEAKHCILRTLARLRWAGKIAVQAAEPWLTRLQEKGVLPAGKDTPKANDWQDFNELLVLGYMEKDMINYHDDGEKQLGPTVATMSFGSPAKMSFRPKKKTNGLSSSDKKVGSARSQYSEVLEVHLQHGDIVVMHGAAIHRDYEHAVTPYGKRRFALTSRVIRQDAIPESDRELAAQMSALPPVFDSFAYSGDINTAEQQAALRQFTGQ